MFHRHHWEVVGERFSAPPAEIENFRGTSEAALRVVYGFTVLTQRCTKCGRVDATQVTGRTNGAV